MSGKFTFFDALERCWVPGSYTNVLDGDFCGSAEVRRRSKPLWITPGVSIYLCEDDYCKRPRLLAVCEHNVPFGEHRVENVPFFEGLGSEFQRGQQWFDLKYVAVRDGSAPMAAPYSGAFGGGCAL